MNNVASIHEGTGNRTDQEVIRGASLNQGGWACHMYQHVNPAAIAEGEKTDSDPFGWKSVSPRIPLITTEALQFDAERHRNWLAPNIDAVRKLNVQVLQRLLHPAGPLWGYSTAAWRISINGANHHADIIGTLRLCGLEEIASDIRELKALADEDSEDSPMDIESLRRTAIFLLAERQFPHPLISVGPGGYVWLEWQIAPHGILGLNFLPSGFIQFSAVSEPPQTNMESEAVEGTMKKDEMLGAIRPFIARLKP